MFGLETSIEAPRGFALSLSRLESRFEYDLPKKAIYDWWTDVSGEGYIGKSLKSTQLIARHGESNVIKTQWETVGKRMTLMERLTVDPPDHWFWESRMFGIDLVHDFRLEKSRDDKTVMTIRSRPRCLKGRIINLMIGWLLGNMMVNEWESADKAFRLEVDTTRRKAIL
jgi:hypothetical protein